MLDLEHSMVRRFFSAVFLVCLVSALAVAAAPSPPNIILITLDTTRADRMGFLGSKSGLTPNLDELAKQGVVFTRAYAQVPLTTPSHAAILTGTYPQFNHIEDLGSPLDKDLPYLPDILHRRGYRSAAFVGAMILDPVSKGAPGFERGFDKYDAGFRRKKPGEDRYKTVERRAGDVVDRALAWLSKRPAGPFFLWLHFYDAHDPYDPPAPYKTRYASAPYDGEIAYTDASVGKFLTALRARGLYAGSTIAVMADHGEAFGEHGEQRHGMFLYDETVHVPFLMKLPASRAAGKRVEARVALADVAPTLLQIAGVPVPKAMQGQSLVAWMNSSVRAGTPTPTQAEHPVYSETNYPRKAFGWSMLRSWRTGKYLYVQAPKAELYDQSIDPNALKNLATDSKAVTGTLESQLMEFQAKTASEQKEKKAMDPAQAENLRALGYLASDESKNAQDASEAAIDPKDKIEIANHLHQALVYLEEEQYDQAIPLLEGVVKAEPRSSTGHLELGRALVHVKRYDEALPVLRVAVEKMPNSGMAHFELGLALVKTGQWDLALPEFQTAVTNSPKSAQLHFYLAAVLTKLRRKEEAIKEYEVALQIDPAHYQTNLIYGRILFMEGDKTRALALLQRAVKAEPESRGAHMYLADVYAALGQPAKANRERALAQQGREIIVSDQ
jgi:arylsulfatase A-like enzyme/thioredoxin-like negative regulator of GroEL